MVRFPRNSAANNLLIYIGIGDEPGLSRPFLKIEEFAEELESLLFLQKLDTDVGIQMCFENRRRFLQIS